MHALLVTIYVLGNEYIPSSDSSPVHVEPRWRMLLQCGAVWCCALSAGTAKYIDISRDPAFEFHPQIDVSMSKTTRWGWFQKGKQKPIGSRSYSPIHAGLAPGWALGTRHRTLDLVYYFTATLWCGNVGANGCAVTGMNRMWIW